MKISSFFLTIIAALAFSAIDHCVFNLKALPYGISGHSGSPTMGKNCSSCHMITNTGNGSTFELTTNIPESGYTPGELYKFSLVIKSKKSKVGFNIRPEDSTGNIPGKLQNMDDYCTVQDDELTHTTSNEISDGIKTINFSWTAPSKGTGEVTFYSAVGTGVQAVESPISMDSLNLSSKKFEEANVTSLFDLIYLPANKVALYPTLARMETYIYYSLSKESDVKIKLLSDDGKDLGYLYTMPKKIGDHIYRLDCSKLSEGAYVASVLIDDKKYTEKFVVRK